MKNIRYFLSKDNKVHTSRDIILSAKIVHNMTLNDNDIDEYIKSKCTGIDKELVGISVEDLIFMGENVKAVFLYKETHNCSVLEARKRIAEISENILKENI